MSRRFTALGVVLLVTAAACGGDTPAAPGDFVVLLKGSSQLAFFAPDGRCSAAVPVGKHPHEMAFAPDGRFAYTSDNGTMRVEDKGGGGNTITVVDLAERKAVGTIDLGGFRRPHGIDVDPNSGLVYVTTEAPPQLLALDPVKRSLVRKYETKGTISHMVTLGRSGRTAYVSNAGSGTVAAIDLVTGDVTLIPTGERPEGSVMSPDGQRLFVVEREAHSVAVIDTDRRKVVGRVRTGGGPVRITRTPDGQLLAVALMHDRAVEFIDPRTLEVTDHVGLTGSAVSISVSADGTRVYAGLQDLCRVGVISVPGRKVLREIATPDGSFPDPALELPPRRLLPRDEPSR